MAVTLAGAAGSIACVLYVGRYNRSHLLIAMFVLWVGSPFVALAYLSGIARIWTARARTLLVVVTIGATLLSLWRYTNVVFGPPRPKPASTFLIVPTVSWLVLTTAIAIAYRRTRTTR
jgi:hypothetical protein